VFRTFSRRFLPNRLDWILKRAAKRGQRKILICWNRGLGDIPLGLAALTYRIFYFLPDASICILTRPNLREGFSLLKGVTTLVDPAWKRGQPTDWKQSLAKLGIPEAEFDLVLEKPSPSDWCCWQHKTFVPRLTWDPQHDALCQKFNLSDAFFTIGVQVEAETNYGLWRNWPEYRWKEFFDLLAAKGNVRVLLFGFEARQFFSHPMVIDLRGKTTLLELLSIIKNRCSAIVLPDSGILSSFYYLDVVCPMRIVSLWADPRHGILKQGVASPNPQVIHMPLIGEQKDLSTVTPQAVIEALFPKQLATPLRSCTKREEVIGSSEMVLAKSGCVILAGGQGSRLGRMEPKGLFRILDKSLFQHLLEKVPVSMPIAIMTSPLNHRETVDYLERNEFFGRQITFFQQEVVDLLNENYQAVGVGPNGNGSLYRSLVESGTLERFENVGVDTLVIVSVDNPLADPADEKLVLFHRQMETDVTIKCVERKKNESMGALGVRQNKLCIVEYFAIEEDKFWFSYTGQVVLSSRFIRKAACLNLPYHWVRKKSRSEEGEKWVWKRERFLFDAFSSADSVKALCYPREMCYAPIKVDENRGAVETLLQTIQRAK